MMYNIRWQMSYFLSDGIKMVAISLTISEIFANVIKCQNFDLELKVQVMEEKNWTYTIELEMLISI